MTTLPTSTRTNPLRHGSFRLLWLGETISVMGDQFYLVALPWLTLSLGGSGMDLGAVLMTAAIPRALLMLLGGAVSDRIAPRTVMLVSNALRFVAVGLLAYLVAGGTVTLTHVYVLAALFGAVDAFYHPALLAIVPSLVGEGQLEPANALVQGSEQLALLLGPAAAGVLVASAGLAPAFAIDALTFVATVTTLLALRAPRTQRADPSGNVARQVLEGLRYSLSRPTIRTMLLTIAALNVAVTGPASVGLPLLAERMFSGPTSFGLLMSCFGGSALVGAILAGTLLRAAPLGRLLILTSSAFAVGLASLAFDRTMLPALLALGVMGLSVGVLNVRGIAFLQGQAEEAFRGRLMSLVMFASVGLAPLSLVAAGALVDAGFVPLFLGAGVLVALVTGVLVCTPSLRRLGSPATA